jgi:membrane protein DedA with SNARE-associated domain
MQCVLFCYGVRLERMNAFDFAFQFHYVALFCLLILGGVGFPFPEDVTFVLAGLLLSHCVIRAVPTFLALYAGLLIADTILYWAGKKYGRKVVAHRPFRLLLTPERIKRLEYKFAMRGTPYILLGRHLPGLRAELFVVAGIMRMSFIKFILADAFSALFSVATWGGIGYLFGYEFLAFRHRFTRFEHKVIFPIVGILLAAGLVYVLIRHYRITRERP